VVGELRCMWAGAQAVRSGLRADPAGRLREQMVVESGMAELEVIDAGGRDPAELAAAVAEDWDIAKFDNERDWPVRMGAITSGGAPTHVVALFNHLVLDGGGLDALFADLAGRDPVTGRPASPVTATQPLAEARWQGSPAGRRQSDRALRHWARLLRAIPSRRFRDPPRAVPR